MISWHLVRQQKPLFEHLFDSQLSKHNSARMAVSNNEKESSVASVQKKKKWLHVKKKRALPYYKQKKKAQFLSATIRSSHDAAVRPTQQCVFFFFFSVRMKNTTKAAGKKKKTGIDLRSQNVKHNWKGPFLCVLQNLFWHTTLETVIGAGLRGSFARAHGHKATKEWR